MSLTVAYIDRTGGGQLLGQGALRLETSSLDAVRLLRARIAADASHHDPRSERPHAALVQALRAEQVGDELVLHSPQAPDQAAQLGVALAALATGELELLVDGTLLAEGATPVSLGSDARLEFVKHFGNRSRQLAQPSSPSTTRRSAPI